MAYDSTDLIPTLLSLSTVRLTHHTLQQAFQQVCTYVSRFKLKLSPVNLLHLKRLVTFLDAINTYIGQWKDERSKDNSEKTEVMKVGDLIGRLGKKIAGINLMEIEAYLKKSKVSRIHLFNVACRDDKRLFRLQGRSLVILILRLRSLAVWSVLIQRKLSGGLIKETQIRQ